MNTAAAPAALVPASDGALLVRFGDTIDLDTHGKVLRLTAALRRMSIVASDQTHRIRMQFTSGSCKLSVQTPDLGEAQEELTVTYESEALQIGFTATYLLEILKVHAHRRGAADLQGS